MGILLDLLTPALDTPSEFSRQASFSTPRWASLTLVLEGDRRTRPVGRSALPQDCCGGARLPYLATEGRVLAVCFLAHWTCLFQRESLWHSAVCRIRNVLSGGGRRPLGGTFIQGVTAFVGSARRGGVYKYQGIARLLSLPYSAIPLALAPLHPLAFLKCNAPLREKICRAAFHLPPRCLRDSSPPTIGTRRP